MHYFIDRNEWLKNIRIIEFNLIFKKNLNRRFKKVLDLGAGEGHSSYSLSSISEFVVALDYNNIRLSRIESDQVNKIVCDAEYLCFKEKQFDLIYASNLLEHVSNSNLVLKNIYNILSDEGIVVITVPNRTWKILHLISFYPNQVETLIKRFLYSSARIDNSILNSNIKNRSHYGFIRRNIWPVPHGVSKSNLSELYVFGRKHWLKIIDNSDFFVSEEIRNMPLYSAYPLSWINSILSILSRFSLSSSHAFIVKKECNGK